MNPTEKFIESLLALLEAHEESTGTYIQRIDIERIPEKDIDNVRAHQRIIEIKLEIT